MATWVTHLMIADALANSYPQLNRRGFCVGNIAPDCNIENEDWTVFTPSREITHWMGSERKNAADSGRFLEAHLLNSTCSRDSEEFAFLIGYYTHLITDAEFQRYIRDEDRVRNVWSRIDASVLNGAAKGMERTWDCVKNLIPRRDRLQWIENMEAEYLRSHPDSGYLTEIIPLKDFPDYLEYLPSGSIVRKIGIMGSIPEKRDPGFGSIALSLDEYTSFVKSTVQLADEKIRCILGSNF